MKDLSKFESVKKALEQVVSESDVNNGTSGIELLAHYWSQENVWDKERNSLQTEIAQKLLSNDITDVKALQDKLLKLPKSKIVMEFRLLQPIPRIQGTKIVTDGDKTFKINMENVTMLYVPEDSVKLGLLEYEETGDKATDSMGRETDIIKLHIKKGLIDIAAPVLDRFDRVIRPKRAYVTAISYKAMQVAGELMNRNRLKTKRRYGFDQEGGNV